MKALYNEYLTGAEREAAIIVAESDAQFAKLDVLFEAVDATLAANMLAAEAKVFTENGTYDDLTMLYKEAGEEATQKKQGILAAIVNAVANLFHKIANFFTTKFGKKVEESVNELPEEELKVDKSFFDKINIFKKGWDILKGSVEKIKAGNYNGIADVAAAWGPIVTAFGGVAAAGTVAVVKRNQIMEWLKFLKDTVLKAVNDAIAKLKAFIGGLKVVKAVTTKSGDEQNKESQGEEAGAEKESLIGKLAAGAENILKSVLSALKTFGGWIAGFLGKLYSALPFGKKQAKEELKNKEKVEDIKQLEAPKDTPTDNKPEDQEVKESVSLFGVTLDSEEVFIESEMSDEEYNELYSLFEEL